MLDAWLTFLLTVVLLCAGVLAVAVIWSTVRDLVRRVLPRRRVTPYYCNNNDCAGHTAPGGCR